MNLTLISIDNNGVVHLSAEGALTAHDFTSDEQNPLRSVVGEHWSTNKIVLNLGEASNVDSSAIGWLLTCQRKAKDNGGKFVLHSVPPNVRQILDMLKVSSILPMAENEDAAFALLDGAQ